MYERYIVRCTMYIVQGRATMYEYYVHSTSYIGMYIVRVLSWSDMVHLITICTSTMYTHVLVHRTRYKVQGLYYVHRTLYEVQGTQRWSTIICRYILRVYTQVYMTYIYIYTYIYIQVVWQSARSSKNTPADEAHSATSDAVTSNGCDGSGCTDL